MNERQTKIFNTICKEPKVTVKELSLIMEVSEVTIRKDLSALEDEGLIKRTHGGVAQINSNEIEKRLHFRYEEKLRIVNKATELIEEGDTILVEAGSTNTLLAREISRMKKINIITNSLYIAEMLKENENAKITLLGGELQKDSEAMVGPITKLCLNQLYVDKAFIGMDGFSEKLGFTCGDFLRAEIGKEMASRAKNVVVLAEASKFENVGVTSIVKLDEVSTVVTDQGIQKERLEILKKYKIEVIVI